MHDDLPTSLLSPLLDLREARNMLAMRDILRNVDGDLLALLVAHCSLRKKYRPQMGALLRAVPRDKLASLGAEKVSQLYKAFM